MYGGIMPYMLCTAIRESPGKTSPPIRRGPSGDERVELAKENENGDRHQVPVVLQPHQARHRPRGQTQCDGRGRVRRRLRGRVHPHDGSPRPARRAEMPVFIRERLRRRRGGSGNLPLRPRHAGRLRCNHRPEARGHHVLAARRVHRSQRSSQTQRGDREDRRDARRRGKTFCLLGVVAQLPRLPESRRQRQRRHRQGHRGLQHAREDHEWRRRPDEGRSGLQGRGGQAQRRLARGGEGRCGGADLAPVHQPPVQPPRREGAPRGRGLHHDDRCGDRELRGRPPQG